MSTSASDIVADRKLTDVPLYSLWDAAHYLRLSPWAAIFLSGQGRFPPRPELFFHHFHRRFPHPAILDGMPAALDHPLDCVRISFTRLAEMFVRAFAFQGLMELGEGGQVAEGRWVSLQEALWRPHDEVGVFGHDVVAEEVTNRLLAPFAERLNEEGLAGLEKALLMRLDRVERAEGVPVRLYPFSRVPAANSPRQIVLDPRIRFGRPTLVKRGVPTDILFERHQAGDSFGELADDYDVPEEEVEEAIRYESAPRDILFPYPGW